MAAATRSRRAHAEKAVRTRHPIPYVDLMLAAVLLEHCLAGVCHSRAGSGLQQRVIFCAILVTGCGATHSASERLAELGVCYSNMLY